MGEALITRRGGGISTPRVLSVFGTTRTTPLDSGEIDSGKTKSESHTISALGEGYDYCIIKPYIYNIIGNPLPDEEKIIMKNGDTVTIGTTYTMTFSLTDTTLTVTVTNNTGYTKIYSTDIYELVYFKL